MAANVRLERQGNAENQKLVVVKWVPDDCNVKQKMLGSTTWNAVKKPFKNGAIFLEVAGSDEKSIEFLAEKLAKTQKNLVRVEGRKLKYEATVGRWKFDDE